MLLYRVILAQSEIDAPVFSSTRSAERGHLAGNLPPSLHYKHVRHPTVQPKQNTLSPRGFCQFLRNFCQKSRNWRRQWQQCARGSPSRGTGSGALCPQLSSQAEPGNGPALSLPIVRWIVDTLAGVSHSPARRHEGKAVRRCACGGQKR